MQGYGSDISCTMYGCFPFVERKVFYKLPVFKPIWKGKVRKHIHYDKSPYPRIGFAFFACRLWIAGYFRQIFSFPLVCFGSLDVRKLWFCIRIVKKIQNPRIGFFAKVTNASSKTMGSGAVFVRYKRFLPFGGINRSIDLRLLRARTSECRAYVSAVGQQ